MPRVRGLHRVHRQRADGVHGQLVDRLGVEVDVRGRPYGHRSGPSFVGVGVDVDVAWRVRLLYFARLGGGPLVRWSRYSAFGPVSGSDGGASLPAGSEV